MKAYFYANTSSFGAATDWQQALFMGVPWVDASGTETTVFTSGNWRGFENVTVTTAERAAIEAAPSWVRRVITDNNGVVLSTNCGLSGTVLVAAIRSAAMV